MEINKESNKEKTSKVETLNTKEKTERTEIAEKAEKTVSSIKDNAKKQDTKNAINKAVKRKRSSWWSWPVKAFIMTIFVSLAFSIISEFTLTNVGIVVSVFLILLLLAVGIIADMIGVAATACSIEPFTAMSSRRVKGARVAIIIVKNSEKVSSICNDIIGDICGILSGAAGAAITLKMMNPSMVNSLQVLIAASVSAIIAGLTIFGKALCKKYAINNCTKIILTVSKTLSLFQRVNKNKIKKD
jgi:hypothetical protein